MSINNNIQKSVIEEVLYQYYKMIATDIAKINKSNPETILNYNLPSFGKLYVSENKKKYIKENDKRED